MFKQERHEQILQILTEKRRATTNYLSEKLFVSPSTIHRDLEQLEKQGFVDRYYGGALLSNRTIQVPPIELRQHEMSDAKQRIGRAARKLVREGDTIFIDASSTCLCMLAHLTHIEHLTVITNSQRVTELLADSPFALYSTGGQLLRNSMAFTGRMAEDFLRKVHIEKYFFSFQGLSSDGVLSDGDEPENRIHQVLLQQQGLKIGLCDGSKFGQRLLHKICTLDHLDYFVSDRSLVDFITVPMQDQPVFLRA